MDSYPVVRIQEIEINRNIGTIICHKDRTLSQVNVITISEL